MKAAILKISTRHLLFQRNVFLALCFILSISLIALSLFLFLKNERIVIVPPVVEKSFWVEANHVSPTYLEQFGHFIGQLILAKSAPSADMQKEIVLRHTDPAFIGTLQRKLLEERDILKKQGSSYVFYPERVEVNSKEMKVLLIGERRIYVEDKQIFSAKESYLLGFVYRGSRLLLSSLEKQQEDIHGKGI